MKRQPPKCRIKHLTNQATAPQIKSAEPGDLSPGACVHFSFERKFMSSLIRKLRKSSRTAAVASLTTLLGAWSPMAAFSQGGVVASQQQPSPPAAQQNSITQPLQLSPEVTRQRVGITPGQVLSLGLQDGIA